MPPPAPRGVNKVLTADGACSSPAGIVLHPSANIIFTLDVEGHVTNEVNLLRARRVQKGSEYDVPLSRNDGSETSHRDQDHAGPVCLSVRETIASHGLTGEEPPSV